MHYTEEEEELQLLLRLFRCQFQIPCSQDSLPRNVVAPTEVAAVPIATHQDSEEDDDDDWLCVFQALVVLVNYLLLVRRCTKTSATTTA